MTHSFLVELGTEELPPTSLRALSTAFKNSVEKGLAEKKLSFETIKAFASPRRLAIAIEGLDESTPVEAITAWGPPAKIAFDADGNPSKAALAFAKKNGIDVSALVTANDGKQDKLMCEVSSGGEATKTLLLDIVTTALANLPVKKRMRWGARRTEFVRPAHWLVMLLDNQVLDGEILGLKAANTSRGHRFHSKTLMTITDSGNYEQQMLDEGKVMVDFDKRRTDIESQVKACADKIGGTAVIDSDLLDEVTALVEWPTALAGKFEEAFLEVPAEALVSSMKEHQKYFHVIDGQGELMPHFITVSNIVSKDPSQVIDGNERVIRPRLADAVFFFETDKKTTLVAQREKLKSVMFQAKLGSIYDKTERIKRLALHIAETLTTSSDLNMADVARAAELCKSDLVSSMVYEFTDLQGIAGYHYALNDGESADVALAMKEQYMPKFSGDNVPSHDIGAIIAIADRIDTITGIFAIGQKPTGSKDPFALRRATLGVLRILVGKSYSLDLQPLITYAAQGFAELSIEQDKIDEVLAYTLDRFKAWYEEENIAAEVFQSVHQKGLSDPLDINRRVHAVARFSELEEAPSLAEANKRVSNILSKNAAEVGDTLDQALLKDKAERDLANALNNANKTVRPLIDSHQYTEALMALADLRDPIDCFFTDVMVMTEDLAVRKNRLALLNQLRSVFLEIADISCLVVKG